SFSDFSWDLTPDGSTIALMQVSDEIELISTADDSHRKLKVKGFNLLFLSYIHWAADGKSLLLASASSGKNECWSIALDGTPHILGACLDTIELIPSPDGKRVALPAYRQESNAWILDNF